MAQGKGGRGRQASRSEDLEAQIWATADDLPGSKADYVLANWPFNASDWRGELLKGNKRLPDIKAAATDVNLASWALE